MDLGLIAVTPPWLGSALWASLALAVVVSLLRRSLQSTSPGELHRYFERTNGDREFAESEKLHRIDVLLSTVSLLLRATWAGSLILLRTAGESVETALVLRVFGEVLLYGILAFELVPQVIATRAGTGITSRALPLLDRAEVLFSPYTRGFRSLRRALLRTVGHDGTTDEADRATEGIRAAVEIGEREGVLEPGEKSMIESMLEFHDAEVIEVMTPRIEMVCLEASCPIEEAIPQVTSCGHSRIPVFRKEIDEIVGVLYAKDLLRYAGDPQQLKLPIEKAVRKIHFVPESKKIGELLAEFRAERFHIAVVLDEYGGTSGLITIEDILEEIVGEIEDEYDSATLASIRRISPVTFDLDGRANIWDVNKALGLDLPESDDYETVAGFIFSTLGRVPKEGDSFEELALRFEITSADERKIKRVRVKLLGPREDGKARAARSDIER